MNIHPREKLVGRFADGLLILAIVTSVLSIILALQLSNPIGQKARLLPAVNMFSEKNRAAVLAGTWQDADENQLLVIKPNMTVTYVDLKEMRKVSSKLTRLQSQKNGSLDANIASSSLNIHIDVDWHKQGEPLTMHIQDHDRDMILKKVGRYEKTDR